MAKESFFIVDESCHNIKQKQDEKDYLMSAMNSALYVHINNIQSNQSALYIIL